MKRNAQVFKKDAGRECRLAKTSNASEAIGQIKHGTDTFILTFGQFSLIDALMVILDQTGPAEVIMSTWTAADASLQRTAAMIESAEITKFRMILDYSFPTRQPEYCQQMLGLFGNDCIRCVRTHAKFIVVKNEKWKVVARTSMNLNENPRLENIEISEDPAFCDFFVSITDNIFKEVKPGGRKGQKLDLEDHPDLLNFPEIKANHIERKYLNEPKTTHQIKNS